MFKNILCKMSMKACKLKILLFNLNEILSKFKGMTLSVNKQSTKRKLNKCATKLWSIKNEFNSKKISNLMSRKIKAIST